MERIIQIATSIFLFFVNFLKRLTLDLGKAIFYQALEFDAQLQQTKSPMQRVGIWIIICTVAFALILLFLRIVVEFLSNVSVTDTLRQ